MHDREKLEARLQPFGQTQLVRYWDRLNDAQKDRLANQIVGLDLAKVNQLCGGRDSEEDFSALAARAQSPVAFRLGDGGARFSPAQAREAADATLAAGQMGVILVAGGQGTRLGFPHPKGMFELGPLSKRTLFEIHFDQLMAVADRHGVRIPLYLMTSPATHEETVEFLLQNDRFGLPAEDLHVFCQGTMPAVDADGKLILQDVDSIFLSPDGHGGMLDAFAGSGAMLDAQNRGLTHLFYFQVDNPLVAICDRELLGYHVLAESDMTTQVVAKNSPSDKVGNVVSVDGHLMVIEYSDLPTEAGERRRSDGSLEFWAGSIAVHVFRLDFLAESAKRDESLPFHRALKKVPCVDDAGRVATPEQPNATKFEKFIFDLMPAAKNAIVVEAAERDAFAPLKNATGSEKDTPETSRAAMIDRDRRMLDQAGITVEGKVVVEINPRFALDADELREEFKPAGPIVKDTYLDAESAE